VVSGSSVRAGEADNEAQGPLDLINLWRVTAQGESPDTWLRLEAGRWDLWRECGPISGGWTADESRFVASEADSGMQSCPFDTWRAPWLTAAATYQRDAEGITLFGATGLELARLHVDGIPPAHPNVADSQRQPPEVSAQLAAAFAQPPELAGDLIIPIASDLEGRWDAVGQFNTEPFIEFNADGSWVGSDGCNGVTGAWAMGDDGRLLATVGPQTLIGCEGVPVGAWLGQVGRVEIEPSGCIPTQSGPTATGLRCSIMPYLVLHDVAGAELGRFILTYRPNPHPPSFVFRLVPAR